MGLLSIINSLNSWEKRMRVEQIDWQESEVKAFEENAFAKKVWLRKDRIKSKETIKKHEIAFRVEYKNKLKKIV